MAEQGTNGAGRVIVIDGQTADLAIPGPVRPYRKARLADRFWPKVRKGDGCWEWTGGRNAKGYGWFFLRGASAFVHRVAWELTNGPIPAGMFVLHRCDNPPCCNPAHLWLGTPADNSADMVAKGRASRNDSALFLAHVPRGADHWTARRAR